MGNACCLQNHGVGCCFGQIQVPPGGGQTVLRDLGQGVKGQACPAGFRTAATHVLGLESGQKGTFLMCSALHWTSREAEGHVV